LEGLLLRTVIFKREATVADLMTLAPLTRVGKLDKGFKERHGNRAPTEPEKRQIRDVLERRRYPGLCALRLTAKLTPLTCTRVQALGSVRSLSLRNVALDAGALFLLSGLESLMGLDLANTGITDSLIPTLIGERNGEGRLIEAHEPRLQQLRVLHLGGIKQHGTDLKTLEMCLNELGSLKAVLLPKALQDALPGWVHDPDRLAHTRADLNEILAADEAGPDFQAYTNLIRQVLQVGDVKPPGTAMTWLDDSRVVLLTEAPRALAKSDRSPTPVRKKVVAIGAVDGATLHRNQGHSKQSLFEMANANSPLPTPVSAGASKKRCLNEKKVTQGGGKKKKAGAEAPKTQWANLISINNIYK